jgi:hypothetical protein
MENINVEKEKTCQEASHKLDFMSIDNIKWNLNQEEIEILEKILELFISSKLTIRKTQKILNCCNDKILDVLISGF